MTDKRRKSAKKYAQTFRLSLLFALMVFTIMFLTISILFVIMFVMRQLGLMDFDKIDKLPLFLFAVASLIIGTAMALIISRKPLKPLNEIMDATDKIANGDYSVRVKPNGTEQFRELGEKFNHMAEEIGSVEMLRTDFVNNFSHEFKTPIVSIRGFARALKWEDLTDGERNEYLDIIISESERLADLSNNVLYLSKIEKQTILTDKNTVNVSEQIRLVIALLYEKWSDKHIDIVFDSDEKYLSCNEELLKQVWINLLDNAIKFSPNGGKIEIRIAESTDEVTVSIVDEGGGMSDETRRHIFDRFYQGDLSHTTTGNGLGLAIVKRIVELHSGNISVRSTEKGSAFMITLPK